MLQDSPEYISECLRLFARSDIAKANLRLLTNLKTSLKQYVLPGFGYANLHRQDIDEILANLTVKEFQNALTYFDQAATIASNKGTNPGTIANYKSVLKRFIQWMQAQGWYEEAIGAHDGKYAPRMRSPVSIPKLTKKQYPCQGLPYRVKVTELTPHLTQQFDQLNYFLTALEIPKRKDPPLREISFQRYREQILGFLGWLKNIEGWAIDDLDLALMADIDLLEEFVAWGINHRGNSYAWAQVAGCAALNIAKWLYHKQSKKAFYRDIEAVELIRAKMGEINQKRKKEPARQALETKLISFEQCLQVVKYLKKCCAPAGFKTKHGAHLRPEHAVMASWQKYLIISILVFCPVRQREIRELELHKTLYREADGYVVKLSAADHKTGSRTGEGREYRLPAQITADLDHWLTVWRPKIQTEHQFVFIHCYPNMRSYHRLGTPFTVREFSLLVKLTMMGATAHLFDDPKLTTPHDFRRIAITWHRRYGRRDQDEALAELMGHSVREADRTYSQLSSRDFTEQAQDWWQTKVPPSKPL
jgi:integrase